MSIRRQTPTTIVSRTVKQSRLTAVLSVASHLPNGNSQVHTRASISERVIRNKFDLVDAALADALNTFTDNQGIFAAQGPDALSNLCSALKELREDTGPPREVWTHLTQWIHTRNANLNIQLRGFISDVNAWAESNVTQLSNNAKLNLLELNELLGFNEPDVPLRPQRQNAEVPPGYWDNMNQYPDIPENPVPPRVVRQNATR